MRERASDTTYTGTLYFSLDLNSGKIITDSRRKQIDTYLAAIGVLLAGHNRDDENGSFNYFFWNAA
jgi:hypothetical protein